MPSNLFIGLTAALSVVGLSEAAAARPCLLGPDDRPAAAPDTPAPSAAVKGHGPKVHRRARTPGPCEVEPTAARTILNGTKPIPRMLAPQRDDH